jgi:hypothetical protein
MPGIARWSAGHPPASMRLSRDASVAPFRPNRAGPLNWPERNDRHPAPRGIEVIRMTETLHRDDKVTGPYRQFCRGDCPISGLLRSGAASVAAGERTSPGHCGRQFHRSLDTFPSSPAAPSPPRWLLPSASGRAPHPQPGRRHHRRPRPGLCSRAAARVRPRPRPRRPAIRPRRPGRRRDPHRRLPSRRPPPRPASSRAHPGRQRHRGPARRRRAAAPPRHHHLTASLEPAIVVLVQRRRGPASAPGALPWQPARAHAGPRARSKPLISHAHPSARPVLAAAACRRAGGWCQTGRRRSCGWAAGAS